MTRAWDKEMSLSFITIHDDKEKIYRAENSPSLSFITIHDDINIADPSSIQDACHIRTQ